MTNKPIPQRLPSRKISLEKKMRGTPTKRSQIMTSVDSSSKIFTPDKNFIKNLQNFKIIERLGKGAYAKVHLIQHKTFKEYFALKTYPKSYLSKPHRIYNIKNEVSILLKCKHPNIIVLHSVCETQDNVR